MVISLGAMSAPVFADAPAPIYQDVLGALQSGKTVKVLTDLSHCATTDAGKAASAVQGGLQINAFMVVPDKGIFFSDVSFQTCIRPWTGPGSPSPNISATSLGWMAG
jgi:hypothetical protein